MWAEPCFEDEGFTLTRIHVRTDLVDGFTASPEQLAALMSFSFGASLCGPIRDPRTTSRIQFASSMYVHEAIAQRCKGVLAWVTAIQAVESHLFSPILAEMLGLPVAATSHPHSGPRSQADDMLSVVKVRVAPAGQGASLYPGPDFLDTLAWLQRYPAVLATGGNYGLAAEFPFGGATSLLQMRTDEAHPMHGHGLLSLLKLPQGEYGRENPKAAKLALELNEQETRSQTFSHFLGSWCPGENALTYVSFWPNVMHAPALLQALIEKAAIQRSFWVAEQVFGVDTDLEKARRQKAEMMTWAARVLASRSDTNPSTIRDCSVVRVSCPHCGKKYKVQVTEAQTALKCRCGHRFHIPPR